MTVRKRQRAAKNHATKNRRISGASRSAHARAHYQARTSLPCVQVRRRSPHPDSLAALAELM
jgi:hypothetical protein